MKQSTQHTAIEKRSAPRSLQMSVGARMWFCMPHSSTNTVIQLCFVIVDCGRALNSWRYINLLTQSDMNNQTDHEGSDKGRWIPQIISCSWHTTCHRVQQCVGEWCFLLGLLSLITSPAISCMMREKGLVFPLSLLLFTSLRFLDQYYLVYLTNLVWLLSPQLSLL